MTVCIAAACDADKLILVTDHMLSLGFTSAEAGVKGMRLSDNWHLVFAADDTTLVTPIVRRIVQKIKDGSDAVSYEGISRIVATAYQDVRRTQVEDLYLSPYGLTIAEFREKGYKFFKDYYLTLLNHIERFDAKCEFIISGFAPTPTRQATIFRVVNPGVIEPAELMGYTAIGMGWINAIAHLTRKKQGMRTPLAESIYNVLSAKFLSEIATGVGKETTVIVAGRGTTKLAFLEDTEIEEIRNLYGEEQQKAQAQNLEQQLQAIVKRCVSVLSPSPTEPAPPS